MSIERKSLQKKANQLIRSISSDFTDKRLRIHVVNLMDLLISEEATSVYLKNDWQRILDMKKFHFQYELLEVRQIQAIGRFFHADLYSELVRFLLRSGIEYYSLIIATKEEEKKESYARLKDAQNGIIKLQINEELWDGSSVNKNLHDITIDQLANAFISAML